MIKATVAGIDEKFLLGILNSKATGFYWQNKFSDFKETFPKIKGSYLQQLPIPTGDKSRHDQMVRLVEQMLEGCQNCPLLEWHILRPRISGTLPGKIPIPFHNRSVELSQFVIVVFWHPSGVREIGLFRLPGVSSLRSSTHG